MTALVANGTLFALILAFTLIEAVALARWRARRGHPASDVVLHLAAGAFLTLAAWLALAGVGWGWVAASLVLSGLAHVADLRRRFA